MHSDFSDSSVKKSGLLQPQYVVSLFCLFLLCWLFPYTGDDWTWGGQIGIERLQVFFKDYGGRYFGYLIVLALTRSVWLRALAMALVYTGTSILIEKIVRHPLSFYLSLLFFFCLPKLIWRQAVVWTSGFSNYGTATLFSLLFAYYTLSVFRDSSVRGNTIRSTALLFLLGLANSLILENMALYMLCMSILTTLFYHRRRGVWNRAFISHGIGTILGCLLMFSNSAYRNILSSGDSYSYRKFSIDTLAQRIYENWTLIYQEGFLGNIVLNTAFFALCFLCVVILVRQNRLILKKVLPSLLLFGAYVSYSFVSLLYITDARSARLVFSEGIFSFLALIALFHLLYTILNAHTSSFDTDDRSDTALFFMLSFFLILAPLFPVYPIGSRCFYCSYICLVALFCQLSKHTGQLLQGQANGEAAENGTSVIRRLVKQTVMACTSVLYIVFLVLFLSIHRIDVGRLAYIREQAASGETQIAIRHFHHESFLWNATPPQDTKWEVRYKLYYGLPDEICLIPVWD